MKRILLLSIFALVAALPACSGDQNISDIPPPTGAAQQTVEPASEPDSMWAPGVPANQRTIPAYTPFPDVSPPNYWMRQDRPGYLTINVADTPTAAGANQIIEQLASGFAHKGGGWFVNIDCGTSQDATGGTRIGTAKFATNSLGAAQTGLPVGHHALDLNPEASCP